ncbi:DUF6444 domain-containing protein [Fluoribacter gormanii]|uniref:DUF6444 domain-containing protein n=1 Tax=Fluoribacter gormanii TaxID=464 RepID=UPI000B317B69
MKYYEQIISTLLARIAELEKRVTQQAARIAELEKRLNKNSSNSSKPPSCDGSRKPPRTTSLRENGKHKSGSHKGHKGMDCVLSKPALDTRGSDSADV